jgi:hypothetical protein
MHTSFIHFFTFLVIISVAPESFAAEDEKGEASTPLIETAITDSTGEEKSEAESVPEAEPKDRRKRVMHKWNEYEGPLMTTQVGALITRGWSCVANWALQDVFLISTPESTTACHGNLTTAPCA